MSNEAQSTNSSVMPMSFDGSHSSDTMAPWVIENVFRALPEAIYITDTCDRITFFNKATTQLLGISPEIGQTLANGAWKLFWPDGRELPYEDSPMAVALKEKRSNRGREILVERPDGSRLLILVFPTPIFDATGLLIGTINMLIDVNHRSVAYDELQRMSAIVESSDDAILAKDLNGIIISWNKGAERLFGYNADEILGKSVVTLIPLDRHDEEPSILTRIRAGERIDHYETIRRRKDGSLIEISLSISPIHNREGRVIGAAKIARDITDRRRAEEQQRLLIQEMNHRIKNLFTLASSVVSLSRRSADTIDELVSDIAGRLQALALAHNLTVSGISQTSERSEQEATLHALVRTITSPFDHKSHTVPSRIDVSGCDFVLSDSSVTSFALLLHEFATNAAKYGALSTPEGRVSVRAEEMEDMLMITWIETSGPLVIRGSDGEGFGSILGRATVQAQFGGEITREWRPEGLIIRLSIARDRL